MKKTSNYLWGIVLIGIGAILGLNALGIADINLFFDGWWTLFIIVPCAISLFANHGGTGDLVGLIVGVLFLLACQGVIRFDLLWKLLFPIILVLIGLSLIFKDVFHGTIKKEIAKLNRASKDKKEYCATFGEQKVDLSSEVFEGAELTSVFGSIEFDLVNAKVKEDQVIEASAIFGGITIFVPKDVNVKVNATPVFGGVDNHVKNKEENKKTIYVNASAIFGGIDIK